MANELARCGATSARDHRLDDDHDAVAVLLRAKPSLYI
jgi:hypothetical protein